MNSSLLSQLRSVVDASATFARVANELAALGRGQDPVVRRVLAPDVTTRVERAVALDYLLSVSPTRGADFLDELLVLCSYPDLGGGNRLRAMRELSRIPRSRHLGSLWSRTSALLAADPDSYRYLLPLLDLVGDADTLMAAIDSAARHPDSEVREQAASYRELLDAVTAIRRFASAFRRWGLESCALEHEEAGFADAAPVDSGRPAEAVWVGLRRAWEERREARYVLYQTARQTDEDRLTSEFRELLSSAEPVARTAALEFLCEYGVPEGAELVDVLVDLSSSHASYHVLLGTWASRGPAGSRLRLVTDAVTARVSELDAARRHRVARFVFYRRWWPLLMSAGLVDDLACRRPGT